MTRQTERRNLFESALATMPAFEAWSETRPKLTDEEYFYACRKADAVLERETVTVNHCKLIPRRIRRDMARQLSHRQWKGQA